MKKILGLDLGTNSIGWALIEIDHENKIVSILGLGSRILSMDAGEISTFESGSKLKSAAAQRTQERTARKLNERFLLRRDRLHCILNLLKTLPPHYTISIDFENEKGYRSGKFKKEQEVKLAYIKDEKGKNHFLFMDSYNEMVEEFKIKNPSLFYTKPNGKMTKIPYDWTLYYLRKKAMYEEIAKGELAWITLSFNQKRGYEKIVGQDEKEQKEGQLSETFIGIVQTVTEVGSKDDLKLFEIILEDKNSGRELYRYKEESLYQITFKDDLKEIEIISKYNNDGEINGHF